MSESFKDLGLHQSLFHNLEKVGYETPTEVQLESIPVILEGRDILATAQTGTGKTASYILPLATRLLEEKNAPKPYSAKVLILTPTRELASQVFDSIKELTENLPLSSAVVFGGVGINPQKAKLKKGVDFLVATPGRLLDLMQQKAVTLSHTHYLVLDEADRMLDMGFVKDIRRILKTLPEERQTLLFSATISPEIKKLTEDFLKDPKEVAIGKNKEAPLIRQTLYKMPKKFKHEALRDLIVDNNWNQVLVFTRTKHGADKLNRQLLRDGFTSMVLHGDKSQAARMKALQSFKDKTIRVLVATDIAARGLDIEKLPQIVNFDRPQQAEDYVHRIGRTGRAGERGEAISLVSNEEKKELRSIEKFIKKTLKLSDFPGFDYSKVPDEPATPAKPRPRRNFKPARNRTQKK